MPIGMLPEWTFYVGVAFLLVLAFWWYQEKSIRGVKRRSERASRRTAGYVGAGVVAIFGVLAGVLDVGVEVLGQIGDVVIPSSPDFLAQLAITGLGWLTMRGSLQMKATTFVAIAAVVILVAISLDN